MIDLSKYYRKASMWVMAGQCGLLLGILVSSVLLPQFLMSGGGISNYGVHQETVALYSTGFVMAAIGAIAGGYLLESNSHYNARLVSRCLGILAALYLLILVSTYSYQLSNLLNLIHQTISTVLYIFMTALAVYLTFNMPRTITNRTLRYALYCAVLMAGLTYAGVVNLLFIAETMTGLLFGVILIRYLRLLDK